MSASTKSKRGSRETWSRFRRVPVMRLSTPVTRQPSARKRSTRWLPMKPAAPRMTALFSDMSWNLFLRAHVIERELARQGPAVVIEDHVDPLPDVLGDRHARAIVQQL